MKHILRAAGTISAILGLLAGIRTGAAHHSASMYDDTKILTIHGTVKEVRWVNPHVSLSIYGMLNEGDEPTDWLLETTSPGRLTRLGWTRPSVKVGDRVLIEIHPLRDGVQHGGSIQKLTSIETGKSYGTNLRELDSPDHE